MSLDDLSKLVTPKPVVENTADRAATAAGSFEERKADIERRKKGEILNLPKVKRYIGFLAQMLASVKKEEEKDEIIRNLKEISDAPEGFFKKLVGLVKEEEKSEAQKIVTEIGVINAKYDAELSREATVGKIGIGSRILQEGKTYVVKELPSADNNGEYVVEDEEGGIYRSKQEDVREAFESGKAVLLGIDKAEPLGPAEEVDTKTKLKAALEREEAELRRASEEAERYIMMHIETLKREGAGMIGSIELNVRAQDFFKGISHEYLSSPLGRELKGKIYDLERQYREALKESEERPDASITVEGKEVSMYRAMMDSARKAFNGRDGNIINLQTGEFSLKFTEDWRKRYTGPKLGTFISRIIKRAEKDFIAEIFASRIETPKIPTAKAEEWTEADEKALAEIERRLAQIDEIERKRKEELEKIERALYREVISGQINAKYDAMLAELEK
ncbi:MAG: hypothetical protein G01um101424_125 [Parcubacteria group bacterium Gr01-1014_24]|nr:MAG: hypothetical protein G01um101424_125 [Parcubacteria group bacterium Gr01-1014_24]